MKRTILTLLIFFAVIFTLNAQTYGPGDFVTVWKTVEANQQIALPLIEPGDYEYPNMRYGGTTVVTAALPSDFSVDWGDGNQQAGSPPMTIREPFIPMPNPASTK
jgi:hypothetical protein